MTRNDDRQIHAYGPGNHVQVVRYARAGKWYIEGATGIRQAVTVTTAAATAAVLRAQGGTARNTDGGAMFWPKIAKASPSSKDTAALIIAAVTGSDRCATCSEPGHDVCSLIDGCPCCDNTTNAMQDA